MFLGVDTPADGCERAVTAAAGGDACRRTAAAGRDYRVLTVGGQVVAAAERVAAHVVGDGATDVAGLVDRANEDPRRGVGHARRADPARPSTTSRCSPRPAGPRRSTRSRPPAQVCAAREREPLHRRHQPRRHRPRPPLRRRAVRPGRRDRRPRHRRASTCGCPHRRPAAADRRAGPADRRRHRGQRRARAAHAPGPGGRAAPATSARDRARRCTRPAAPSRIPIVAITGTNGKTTVARLTAHLLAGAGLRVGVATTDGVSIGGRLRPARRRHRPAVRAAWCSATPASTPRCWRPRAAACCVGPRLRLERRRRDHQHHRRPPRPGRHRRRSRTSSHVKALIAERVREGGTLVLNADDPLGAQPRRPAAGTGGPQADHLVQPATRATRSSAALGHGRHRRTCSPTAGSVEPPARRRTPLLAVAELPGGVRRRRPSRGRQRARRDRRGPGPGRRHRPGRRTARCFDPAAHNPGRGTLLRLGEAAPRRLRAQPGRPGAVRRPVTGCGAPSTPSPPSPCPATAATTCWPRAPR